MKKPREAVNFRGLTDCLGVDMSNHSGRGMYGQDVICTALGCKADVDPRFHPSMTCTSHAVKLAAAVMAHKEFIQGWVRAIDAAENPKPGPIPKKNVVYYIEFAHGIKIGTTSNLAQRLQSFALPESAVLAVEPGGFEIERSRHEFFKESRLGRTEVFRDCPKIRNHIDAVKKYHGEPNVAACSR